MEFSKKKYKNVIGVQGSDKYQDNGVIILAPGPDGGPDTPSNRPTKVRVTFFKDPEDVTVHLRDEDLELDEGLIIKVESGVRTE